MKRIDIICYMRIFGGLMLVFPLFYAFWALDFGFLKGGIITLGIYVFLMLIVIPMFNYFEYGMFWYWISDERRKNLYNKTISRK